MICVVEHIAAKSVGFYSYRVINYTVGHVKLLKGLGVAACNMMG